MKNLRIPQPKQLRLNQGVSRLGRHKVFEGSPCRLEIFPSVEWLDVAWDKLLAKRKRLSYVRWQFLMDLSRDLPQCGWFSELYPCKCSKAAMKLKDVGEVISKPSSLCRIQSLEKFKHRKVEPPLLHAVVMVLGFVDHNWAGLPSVNLRGFKTSSVRASKSSPSHLNKKLTSNNAAFHQSYLPLAGAPPVPLPPMVKSCAPTPTPSQPELLENPGSIARGAGGGPISDDDTRFIQNDPPTFCAALGWQIPNPSKWNIKSTGQKVTDGMKSNQIFYGEQVLDRWIITSSCNSFELMQAGVGLRIQGCPNLCVAEPPLVVQKSTRPTVLPWGMELDARLTKANLSFSNLQHGFMREIDTMVGSAKSDRGKLRRGGCTIPSRSLSPVHRIAVFADSCMMIVCLRYMCGGKNATCCTLLEREAGSQPSTAIIEAKGGRRKTYENSCGISLVQGCEMANLDSDCGRRLQKASFAAKGTEEAGHLRLHGSSKLFLLRTSAIGELFVPIRLANPPRNWHQQLQVFSFDTPTPTPTTTLRRKTSTRLVLAPLVFTIYSVWIARHRATESIHPMNSRQPHRAFASHRPVEAVDIADFGGSACGQS
ncbi:uncharacterized protein BDR25DRAFT_396558, partial [Lindgomyces ingoldianus]